MSVKNPFVISAYVSPYYFCDRKRRQKLTNNAKLI